MTRAERIDPLALSAIPMGIGGLFLVPFIWPLPALSWPVVRILVWLTLINSATAFVLWNQALKHMQAFEISITANLMPLGTAILAPFFLGEIVPGNAWVGMLISLMGVVLVGVGGRSVVAKQRML
jgi:drug/metabolite transporter (DMT)-like permease